MTYPPQQPPQYPQQPSVQYAQPPQPPPQQMMYAQPQQPVLRSDEEILQSLQVLLGQVDQMMGQLAVHPSANSEPIAMQYIYPQLRQVLALIVEQSVANLTDTEGDDEDGEESLAYRNLVDIVERVVTHCSLPTDALSALMMGLMPCFAELKDMSQAQFEAHFAPQIAFLNEQNAAVMTAHQGQVVTVGQGQG